MRKAQWLDENLFYFYNWCRRRISIGAYNLKSFIWLIFFFRITPCQLRVNTELIKWVLNNLSNSCGWISIRWRRQSDIASYFRDDETSDHPPVIFVNVMRNETTRPSINLNTFWQLSLNLDNDVLLLSIWVYRIYSYLTIVVKHLFNDRNDRSQP